MENPSTNKVASRANFGFAFNDPDFSDGVLRIEIMADSLDPESDSNGKHTNSESSTIVKVITFQLSSPILAENSPFFHKLFNNGMRESQQRNDVTLRINESEEAALTDLLNFMYNSTLSATIIPNLLGVLIIADKFEVISCMGYCSDLLQKMPLSLESSISYLELPSSILVAEVVQPLIDKANKWVVERYKDINKSQDEAMALPLSAIEVVLGHYSLQVKSVDDVFEFIVKWACAHYPKLKERREILTKRLTQFISFPYMSCSKLKEVLVCPYFDHEEVSKLVNEALFFKVELPYGQHIHASNKYQLIKVEQFELPQPRCVVYFDLKREECENLFPSRRLDTSLFLLGGRWFRLSAECVSKEQEKSFGLFVRMTKE